MNILRAVVSTGMFPAASLLTKIRAKTHIRILLYHRINDDLPDDRLSVPTAEFRRQLSWLTEKGYQSISLGEYMERRQGDCDFSRSIMFTFDDGYADNVLTAAPFLQEFGFRATFFVTTGYIGTDRVFPRYHGKSGEHRCMTWSEVKALAAAGHEVGAHSVNHVRLGHAGEEEAKLEIERSRQDLCDQGLSADWFCYPSGSISSSAIDQVRRAGFQAALTTMPGANSTKQYAFLLRRTEIAGGDTMFDFRKKLAGAFDLPHRFTHYRNQRR